MKTLHHLILAAIASIGTSAANGPALGQDAPAKWKPTLESVIISAQKPMRNYRLVLSSSHLGEAFFVSASIDVPYNDLDLIQDAGAQELDRRIHVAARMVCQQLDRKYPQALYPILEGFDCVQDAAREGMDRANLVIANARHG
jgi:UrcA family protein